MSETFNCCVFLLLFWNFHYNQACTNQSLVNCSNYDASTRRITVWGNIPSGNCILVTIGTTNYLFDPVMINSVWITLNNTNGTCINDIAALAQSLTTTVLIPPSNQEIILLNVTALYYRMVVVTKLCTSNCSVNPVNSILESQLKALKLYPIFNNWTQYGPYCFNNGFIDPSYTGAGYKCVCPANSNLYGPACEYVETKLTTALWYFNIFRNAATINVRFSIFSNGITGNVSIISIKNGTFQTFIQVGVVESDIVLNIENDVRRLSFPRIDDQNWYDMYLIINRQNVTFSINSSSILINLTSQSTSDYRSFYMVIYEYTSAASISLRNFIASSKLIDFNNPAYRSGCVSRCNCTSTQLCNCRPFVSITSNPCYCKPGYLPSSSTCVPNNVPNVQIASATTAQFPINNILLAIVDFGFQTLSINGTLLTITLTNPSLTISVQIVNTNLTLSVSTLTTQSGINYNVSNGWFHNVTLNVKTYALEMILDSNYNYTRNIFNWYPVGASTIFASLLTIGPMQLPFISTINNLTTCFSVIRLNSATIALDTFPSLNPSMASPCTTGPRCSSNQVNCSLNQVCSDTEWQNTKCICIANFTSVNGTCTYNQCSVNPCLNNGQCVYNATSSNFSCICVNNYSGPLCGTAPTYLWWIAVGVVLFLLIILIVALLVYCCCYRHRDQDAVPFIIKVNENIAVYNEQAGECDYKGPPINFALMQNALIGIPPVANGSVKEIPNLMNKKEEFDKNNVDLILDHPLDFGYEGYDSDNNSISSIGSRSAGSQENNDDAHNFNNLEDICT